MKYDPIQRDYGWSTEWDEDENEDNMRFLTTIAQRDAMIEALTETNKDLGAGYAAEADEADKLHKELMVYRRKLHIMERRARRLYEDWMSELRMRKAREE